MDPQWVKTEAHRLIDLGILLNPEGESLDLSDCEYTPQNMAELRSFLSSMRSAIDAVNGALARTWSDQHEGSSYSDGVMRWWVGRTKKKVFIKDSGFYEWLATKTPDELEALVNPTTIKVTGLSPAERQTFFDESQHNDRLTIQSIPETY